VPRWIAFERSGSPHPKKQHPFLFERLRSWMTTTSMAKDVLYAAQYLIWRARRAAAG
jgi:hypothetical protein